MHCCGISYTVAYHILQDAEVQCADQCQMKKIIIVAIIVNLNSGQCQ